MFSFIFKKLAQMGLQTVEHYKIYNGILRGYIDPSAKNACMTF